MRKPIVISIVNHKGGCLKTTVTANLGAALARAGKKVLVVDLDAQQNLTTSLIGPQVPERGKASLYDAICDETSLDQLIHPTNTAGLDIVPCTEDFAGADLTLVSAVGREFMLSGCLKKTTKLSDYDLVLMDNAPSISLVVMNSLVASDYFLVPCSAEYLPMLGLSLLGGSIGRMSKLAPNLRSLGVVLTMYSRNERICRQVESTLRKELGATVFQAKIRVNTKAKSAPSVRQTIFEYENSKAGRGTEDFGALAAEFLERLAEREQEPLPIAANG
jgi:chromosome partitioning protein